MKLLKGINATLGVLFTGIIVVAAFDLDDKLMEKAEPYLVKMAQAKAAKKAAAQAAAQQATAQ